MKKLITILCLITSVSMVGAQQITTNIFYFTEEYTAEVDLIPITYPDVTWYQDLESGERIILGEYNFEELRDYDGLFFCVDYTAQNITNDVVSVEVVNYTNQWPSNVVVSITNTYTNAVWTDVLVDYKLHCKEALTSPWEVVDQCSINMTPDQWTTRKAASALVDPRTRMLRYDRAYDLQRVCIVPVAAGGSIQDRYPDPEEFIWIRQDNVYDNCTWLPARWSIWDNPPVYCVKTIVIRWEPGEHPTSTSIHNSGASILQIWLKYSPEDPSWSGDFSYSNERVWIGDTHIEVFMDNLSVAEEVRMVE